MEQAPESSTSKSFEPNPEPSTTSPNPWLTSPSHNDLVTVSTHSLQLQVSGPARKAKEPVAVIIQGLGSQISSWAAVTRLLSPHIRTYSYSRSGFTPSEDGPSPPTSGNIGTELDMMLQEAEVKPPYILIAHSWGGVILPGLVVKFLKENIVGVVLVEANQVRTLEVLDWRPISLWFAASGVDVFKVLEMEKQRKLNDGEWETYLKDTADEQNKKAGEKEWAEYEGSFRDLKNDKKASRLALDCPMSVIKGQNGRALKKIYDAVIESGYGTEEEKKRFADFLKTFDEKDLEIQSQLTKLSSNSRFVVAENSGHMVQMTEPEVIVEEVRWILEHISKVVKK